MSSYAYRKIERTNDSLVFAEEATFKDRGIPHYCPNPDCPGLLFLCNTDNPDIKPYFRATLKEHRHAPNCSYAVISFNAEDHNESKFDFERATSRVMRPSRSGYENEAERKEKESDQKDLPPHTIKQIYSMAKNYPIDHIYNGISIWRILADERTRKIYHKGIYRTCLVEAKFAGFIKEQKVIRLKYYINNIKFHYLRLNFLDEAVFNEIISEILVFYQSSPIVIWGKWKMKDNHFATDVYSKSQIYIPYREKKQNSK